MNNNSHNLPNHDDWKSTNKWDHSKSLKDKFWNLCAIIARLRHPKNGCPWDLAQTHKSLQRFMLEEAYETVAVMDQNNQLELADELGDVLLQVILNAQLAHDAQNFDIETVIDSIATKMLRRHPHVFENQNLAKDMESLHQQWELTKSTEKNQTKKNQKDSYFKDYSKIFPANISAQKIGEKSKHIGFDWESAEQVLEQLESEMSELRDAFNKKTCCDDPELLDEVGDVYFSLTQFCRHIGHQGEALAARGNLKFLNRFKLVERQLEVEKIALEKASPSLLHKLWIKAKSMQQNKK